MSNGLSISNTSYSPATGLITAIMLILIVVAHWKMFTKAGEKGWKSLIPFYSDYILYKLVWEPKHYFVFLGSCVGMVLFNVLNFTFIIADGMLYLVPNNIFIFTALASISSFVLFGWYLVVNIRTALAYGKSMFFALGLVLLPSIFTMIIGFGKAEYRRIPAQR
ncbi:MAG: DUF5684 domain-containing protein [Coriobacteriales bacterium]|nr:DUF5684 domain-containing protein [Coriobacteriales bacterium]